MKLLYISTVDHIIHVMLPHLDAARARGWQVDIACHITRDPAISKAHCDTLYEVPLSRNPFHPSNLLAVWKLIKLIRKEKYDIVHCHNPSGGVYGRLAATLSGVKPLRVYTAHGFHFHPLGGRITNTLFRAIESFAGRYLSDAVLTINQWDYEQAKKMMPPERVFLTPGVGISTDKFDPVKVSDEERLAIRKEFGVPNDGFLVTCIGEFIPRKQHEHLFQALQIPAFHTKYGAKTVLVLVGVGEREAELKALATQSQIETRFTGYRRDVSTILSASDIFLFPSMQEGLACSVQEALAMGIPVATYDIRGCSDLVGNDSGIVVPACDSEKLGHAVVELMELSEERRAAIGRIGRKKMVELYDRPKCVEAWLKIYETCLPAAALQASHSRSPGARVPDEVGEGMSRLRGGGGKSL